MAKITFWGATGTVTGSRFIVDVNEKRFLIDCGMFQGPKENRLKNWELFPVTPSSIDRVMLTHAHIDHTGYLPRLCRNGFTGPVHCTHATADLCDIMLKDSAHIQEEDARWANKKGYSKHSPAKPLYTVEDAENALTQFAPVYFGESFMLDEGLRLKLRDSGHILGSSFVDIKKSQNGQSRKILFSGDLGRSSRPILRDPDQVFNVDYLVLESTYGNRLHQPGLPMHDLARVIQDTTERGGVVLIPAFSIGRTQTLLYVLRQLEDERKIPLLPVFVDSPMAIEATAVFENRISEMDMDARVLTLQGKKIMHPQQLKLCETRDQSKEINDIKTPAIIISASGMATAGRILHHLKLRLPDPKNTILLIGYQAHGTRGRDIMDGKKSVKIHGQDFEVKARVETILGYSGHADYNEILAWLMGLNRPPEKTFLVHGEPEASQALAEKIKSHFNWDVVVPEYGDSFEINL
jgi:metallo-beta-lactamase family protein